MNARWHYVEVEWVDHSWTAECRPTTVVGPYQSQVYANGVARRLRKVAEATESEDRSVNVNVIETEFATVGKAADQIREYLEAE